MHEARRFDEALERMHLALDEMLAAEEIGKSEYRDILEAYRMFAADRGWIERIRAHIQGGLSAEAAVQRAQEENRARMRDITDPYLRERLCDLEDLTDRLMLHLMGQDPAERKALPPHAILVARTLGPADLLDYDLSKVHGVVLEEGSPSMHVAIIARALSIPMVARVPAVLGKIGAGDPVIVDGDNGSVFIRPGEDVSATFVATVRMRREKQKAYATLRDLPAESRDGVRVSLLMNAGLLADLPVLNEVNADGIGLYRTELPFMVHAETPDVDVQTALYRSVIDQAGKKPVCFRTLDGGGDKMLPYWQSAGEENPAMGWRSIRITLDHPAIMRQQLRALIRAADGRPLAVMFPMVAEVAEFDAARRILDLELVRAQHRGDPVPSELSVGCMVEVPSIVFQLPQLLQRVDFLSVGSNDLAQFLFARDRGNQRIAERYDLLSPPFLTFLERILEACDAAESRVPVRRNGGQPAGRDDPGRPGLPQAFGERSGGGAGQGDDPGHERRRHRTPGEEADPHLGPQPAHQSGRFRPGSRRSDLIVILYSQSIPEFRKKTAELRALPEGGVAGILGSPCRMVA
jgi:phosphotransferase system enzyme I (PtsP)